MNPEAILRVVPQRTDTDCTIAVLATLYSLLYEDVLIAAAKVANYESGEGMYLTQVQQTAEELGYELKRVRPGRYDMEQDTGILHVYDKKRSLYHVVTLRRGLIVETDGTLWDSDVYFAATKFKAGTLLVEA